MIVNNYVMHKLEKTAVEPTLSDELGKINPEVDKYIQKLIKGVIKNDSLRKAKFTNYVDNIVKKCCDGLLYEEDFMGNANEIANHLFEVMSTNGDIDSGCLLVCTFSEKDENYVAILKIDYKEVYTQSISIENGKCEIGVSKNSLVLQEKVKLGAIIGLNSINDAYHFRLLDIDAEKEDDTSSFINSFLCAIKVVDNKYKTKSFMQRAEVWITNAMGDDVKGAEDLKSLLAYTLKEKEELNIDEFVKTARLEDDLQDSFKEYMEDYNLSENFEIDKKIVEKGLKKRSVKLSNGFKLNGDLADFEDPMKYIIKKNTNGSTDIVIKNVTSIEG